MADYWIKLYIEMLEDPKIGTLPDGLCWRFVQLCLLAGKVGDNGVIPDTYQIAWVLRKDTKDLEHELNQLAGIGLVTKIVNGWQVTNFEKRQARMTSAEKQKAYRKRLHHEQYADSVTATTNSVTDSVTAPLLKVTQITDNRLTDNRLTDIDNNENYDFFNDPAPEYELTGSDKPFGIIADWATQKFGVQPQSRRDHDAIEAMVKKNVTVDDLEEAYRQLVEKNYEVVSIASLQKAVIAVVNKRAAKTTNIPAIEQFHPSRIIT